MDVMLLRRELDVAFGLRFRKSGIAVTEVGRDDMVVLLRRGHPHAKKPLTLDAYCDLDHVVVSPRGQPGSVVDTALAALGRTRRVALRVPHFTAAVLVTSRSDLVTALPRSFARALRAIAPFVERELPLASPTFSFEIAYARARENEPALAWLAEQVATTCQAVFVPPER